LAYSVISGRLVPSLFYEILFNLFIFYKIKKTIKCLPKLSFPKTSKKNNKETLNSEKLLNKPEKPDNKKTNKKNNNGSNNLTNTNKNT
jgi:hypothetical protein